MERQIKVTSTKNQITSNKRLSIGAIQVKNYFSESKSHSLNAAHDQKTSLAPKKLVHAAILLTFAYSSKQRLNE